MFLTEAVVQSPEPEHIFHLFLPSSGSSGSTLPLSGDLTLGHIIDKHWKSNQPLELLYTMDSSGLTQ